MRSTGCQRANWDAGGTALLGLRRGWGRPDAQLVAVCPSPSTWPWDPRPPLGRGTQFAEPLSRHPLALEPIADAGGAGFPPPHGFEVVLLGLRLQVSLAQSS